MEPAPPHGRPTTMDVPSKESPVRTAWLLILVPLLACSTTRAVSVADGTSAGLPSTADGEAARDTVDGKAMVIRAFVRLERDDPEAGPARAEELAKAHGGYLQQASKESVTVRLPAAHLESFLGALGTLGAVQDKVVQRDDVTEAHQDLKVRLDNLRRTRERYLALLERATNVTEAVAVERELERVTAEYEALKARVDALESSVALSTVRMDFARPLRPGPIGWIFRGLFVGVKWLFVWD